MNRFANRNTSMFCTVSLPRKWSMRKIWSSRQYAVQLLVERERALEVGAERLLDDEAAQAVRLVGEARPCAIVSAASANTPGGSAR